MTITKLTATQLAGLNNMNADAQRGTLGTRINVLEVGGVATPATGTISPMNPVKYTTAPALASATGIKGALALTGSAQTGVTTGIKQPDAPRCATIKGSTGGIAGNIKVYGTDINGTIVNNTIALSGTTVVAGTVAFKTVTAIDYPAETHAGQADAVSVGTGNKIGLPVAAPNTAIVVARSFDGAADGGTLTADVTVGKSVFSPTGYASFNGAKLVEMWILV
jgi:hypothetical protein